MLLLNQIIKSQKIYKTYVNNAFVSFQGSFDCKMIFFFLHPSHWHSFETLSGSTEIKMLILTIPYNLFTNISIIINMLIIIDFE